MDETAKAAKQKRLAQALRANLKRRKEGAGRGREDISRPSDESAGGGEGGASGIGFSRPAPLSGRADGDSND